MRGQRPLQEASWPEIEPAASLYEMNATNSHQMRQVVGRNGSKARQSPQSFQLRARIDGPPACGGNSVVARARARLPDRNVRHRGGAAHALRAIQAADGQKTKTEMERASRGPPRKTKRVASLRVSQRHIELTTSPIPLVNGELWGAAWPVFVWLAPPPRTRDQAAAGER